MEPVSQLLLGALGVTQHKVNQGNLGAIVTPELHLLLPKCMTVWSNRLLHCT